MNKMCAVEYWVRPEAVIECPRDLLQHQCVTITELVSYSMTNKSLNHGNNIVIHFLPGVHVPKAEGQILIENENYDTVNVTATIKGEWGTAMIVCNLSNIVFIFSCISQSHLANIEINSCGYKIAGTMNKIFEAFNFAKYTIQLFFKVIISSVSG